CHRALRVVGEAGVERAFLIGVAELLDGGRLLRLETPPVHLALRVRDLRRVPIERVETLLLRARLHLGTRRTADDETRRERERSEDRGRETQGSPSIGGGRHRGSLLVDVRSASPVVPGASARVAAD